MPKMPQFEITVRGVTAVESNSDGFSDWAEIILDVQYGSHVRRIELTRAAGQEILEQLNKALHPWAGKSIRETVEEELDTVVERLLAEGKPDPGAEPGEYIEYGEERGRAQGLATALAVFINPYKPNVPETKRAAAERVRARET